MNYFEYKDALAGFLLLSYILYNIIVLSKSFILKKKSIQIIKIPVSRNTIQYIFLIDTILKSV